MFGLALGKALVPFRHDLGFSADAHRHQVSFGLSYTQAGWFLVHSPLELGSTSLHSRLYRLNVSQLELRHPAFPLVHQLFPVRTLDTFMMIFYIYLYLLAQIIWSEAP